MIRDAYRMHARLAWAMLLVGVVALVLASVALARPTTAVVEAPQPQSDRPVLRRRRGCNCGGGK